MRVTLIHNPKSGTTDHEEERLVELISRAGHRVDYFGSKDKWKASLDDRPDLVAVAGGDGTVGDVAKVASSRGLPITILPTGTANNVADFLGMSGVPLEDLIAGWTRAELQPFDIGVARGPWGVFRFLESIGVGVLARLMSQVDEGPAAYVNEVSEREPRLQAAREVLKRTVLTTEPVRCEVQLDSMSASGDYLLLEALNFGAAGPNLKLAPHADAADGLLDVVLVEAHERAWLEHHLALLDSETVTPLRVHHTSRLTLRCSKPLLHLDDELRREKGDVEIEASIEPAALSVLVPRR